MSIRDVRGPVVGRIEHPQTFLTPAQVDRLIDDYEAGLSVRYLAQRYEVHRATVSKHLTRRGVERHRPGLDADDAALATRLHREGASMRAIARELGVGREPVRDSLVAAGVLTS